MIDPEDRYMYSKTLDRKIPLRKWKSGHVLLNILGDKESAVEEHDSQNISDEPEEKKPKDVHLPKVSIPDGPEHACITSTSDIIGLSCG